jgi:F-box-like
LRSVEKAVESKQLELNQCNKDIHRLESALKTARKVLDVYQQHRDHLISTHNSLSLGFVEPVPLFNGIPSCEAIESFLAEDIPSRNAICKVEINAVRTACGRVRKTIESLDEELRCQRISLTFTEWSLETSSAAKSMIEKTVEVIRERFRAIKRVPEEIWMEILGMAVQEANNEWRLNSQMYETPSFALPLAQVCCSWRRYMLDAPKLWTTIVSGNPQEKNKYKRDRLITLLVKRSQGNALTVVDNRHTTSSPRGWSGWWPLDPKSAKSILSNYHYHARMWEKYPKIRLPETPWPRPRGLVLQNHQLELLHGVSHEVTNDLKFFSDIALINVPLDEYNSVVSNALTRLKIEFGSTSSVFKPTTSLRYLLSASLQSLELSQCHPDMLEWKGSAFHLPNLQTLSVTPHEHYLMRFLDVPFLSNFKISFPRGPLAYKSDQWIDSFTGTCASVQTIQFIWTKVDTFGIVLLFTKLWESASKLQKMTFSNAKLYGEDFHLAFERSAKRSNRLASLVIDGCVGVSQADCERLLPMVDRLSVFNSEFRTRLQKPS